MVSTLGLMTCTATVDRRLTMTERFDSVCGQMGVKVNTSAAGLTTAPPADSAANDELCRFLARRCDVPLSAVHILSGAGSRQKRVLIKGRSVEQVRAQLHLE